MSNTLKDLVDRTNPIVSAIAAAFGAYWFLQWFRTLNQTGYIIIVSIAAIVYILIARGYKNE